MSGAATEFEAACPIFTVYAAVEVLPRPLRVHIVHLDLSLSPTFTCRQSRRCKQNYLGASKLSRELFQGSEAFPAGVTKNS